MPAARNVGDRIETMHEMSVEMKDVGIMVATRLDMAQQADNYLTALLGSWDELTEEERKEEVQVALNRLRGLYY